MQDEAQDEDLVSSAIGSYKSSSSTLARASKAKNGGEVKHRKDLILKDEWKTTNDGRSFILADEGREDRIIIWGTKAFLKLACAVSNLTIYMDGTFKSAPSQFSQLYTIHCKLNGGMFPIVFALLPNKTGTTYRRFLNMVCSAARKENVCFMPKIVQIDFELSMMQAIEEVFDGDHTEVRGCFFHFTQCIWRKVILIFKIIYL